jgi:hypothetical protein
MQGFNITNKFYLFNFFFFFFFRINEKNTHKWNRTGNELLFKISFYFDKRNIRYMQKGGKIFIHG